MSHYFDDESALEELLNQQLNRAKRASETNASRKIQTSSQAIPPVTQAPVSATPSIKDKGKQELSLGQDAALSKASDTSANRLASWLEGSNKRVQSIPSDAGNPHSLSANDNVKGVENNIAMEGYAIASDEASESLEQSLREEKLQEMSKQRLIKLIMSQIVPVLNSVKKTSSKQLRLEVERLKVDLRSANEALDEAHKYRSHEIELAETKWSSFIRRLEDKLERCEQELANRQKLHRELVEELEKEHRVELKQLEESYRLRLEEEQHRCEATLKRRDEHHALEMKTKVKMGQELEKVDDLFGEVSRTLQGSATDLELQLKLLKDTLDRQKSTAAESNKELAGKTERLCQHYDKFQSQMSQLSSSAQHLSDLIPKLIQVHHESQLASDKIKLQTNELEKRQQELDEQQADVTRRQDKLVEQRFQCGVKESRLVEREERLNERLASHEESSRCLRERERKLEEEELRLRSLRASLDLKGSDIKRLNMELHLSRQKLESRAEELNKADLTLAREREVVEGHWRRLRAEWSRLSGLGKKIHGELKELSMLERTLVCSVCLERLLPAVGSDSRCEKLDSHNNKWTLFDSQQAAIVNQLRRGRLSRRLRAGEKSNRRGMQRANWNNRPSDQGQAEDWDGRQLEEETRYAELVEAY